MANSLDTRSWLNLMDQIVVKDDVAVLQEVIWFLTSTSNYNALKAHDEMPEHICHDMRRTCDEYLTCLESRTSTYPPILPTNIRDCLARFESKKCIALLNDYGM